MRAFAVLMMIQGHTVDTFLAEEYRTTESAFYLVWRFMRGFTAPVFMFTSGLIFTYLLKVDDYNFIDNPRIKKGVKRGLTLIIIGYLLRYPTYRIFDFTYVREAQWRIFFAVDALHLIGFGLLFITLLAFLAKRLHINFNIILSATILALVAVSPFVAKIDWINYLPEYIAAYFYRGTGSLFPFFPWLAYVFSGALLGNFLYNNKEIYFKKRFSIWLGIIGGIFIFASAMIPNFASIIPEEMYFWFNSNSYFLLRVGYVISIAGLISFIVRKVNNVPTIIIDAGKNTLLLYVVHVVMLYGSAWIPGFSRYYGKSFTTIETIAAVIVMFALMFGLVLLVNIIRNFKTGKPLLNKI